MDAQILLNFVIVFACIFLVSTTPASDRRKDIHNLVSLIGSMRNIHKATDNFPALTNFENVNVARVSDLPDNDAVDSNEDEESLIKGYLGAPSGLLQKRQGAWSYDYGLGGGRFGKRNYGDYGIGGGRFGRDVDHVDLSDANDPDISS